MLLLLSFSALRFYFILFFDLIEFFTLFLSSFFGKKNSKQTRWQRGRGSARSEQGSDSQTAGCCSDLKRMRERESASGFG